MARSRSTAFRPLEVQYAVSCWQRGPRRAGEEVLKVEMVVVVVVVL